MGDEQHRLEELSDRLDQDEQISDQELAGLIATTRVEDVAEVFHHLREAVRNRILALLDDRQAAELVANLDEIPAIQVLKDLTPERIAAILNCLPPDEGADVIGFSDEEDQARILKGMEEELATQVQDLASYTRDTAGGVMTSEFVSVGPAETVRSALIKVKTSETADSIHYVYVLDPESRLVGVCSIRELLQARLDQTAADIMVADVVSVPLEMDQEEVSRIISRYDLLQLPVCDAEMRLKGVITADDIMDVMEQESSEDIYRMAGEVSLHPTQQPLLRRLAARMPWLLVTLGGTFLAALLIRSFEVVFEPDAAQVDTIWTLLLAFIPMIGGMAGNVGIQSSTVMVRGLATGEVTPSLLARMLAREISLAATIGIISGGLIGAVVFAFYSAVGVVVALALFAAIVTAALLGTMMPFACLWVRVDPAYASGPVLTTLNDLLGFLIYFLIAIPLVR